MKIFNHKLYTKLAILNNSVCSSEPLDKYCIRDLNTWLNFLCDKNEWLPIVPMYVAPPLAHKTFTSDAAGCTENLEYIDCIGCGNVGFNFEGKIIFAYQLFWPNSVIQSARDLKLCRIGNKTTTLEFLGILIPFLIMPEGLRDQYVEVKVDNVGCYFGWLNRHVANDVMATILIHTLHLICAYLGCQVHISHLPRMSSWDAQVVDRLSRKKSMTVMDRKLLSSFNFPGVGEALENWMLNPTEDWDLPYKILFDVKKRVNK